MQGVQGAVAEVQAVVHAGLNYIRRSLRERAAEVQAGKMQMHHQKSLSQANAVVEGYLRPMRVCEIVCRLHHELRPHKGPSHTVF
jgi:hypothetical protein